MSYHRDSSNAPTSIKFLPATQPLHKERDLASPYRPCVQSLPTLIEEMSKKRSNWRNEKEEKSRVSTQMWATTTIIHGFFKDFQQQQQQQQQHVQLYSTAAFKSWNCPSVHIEQAATEPLAADWPAAHTEQAFVVAMSRGWYLPISQSRHTTEDVAAIFPFPHLAQP